MVAPGPAAAFQVAGEQLDVSPSGLEKVQLALLAPAGEHRLTPRLTRQGGQIGYQVAPRHRRRRHATAMLAAALVYCRDILGMTRVLLTCAESNTASRRVIEGNGAVLDNTLDGECRYWIAIPETRHRAE
jgi:RimJ/RimL family protein N-acetyltransferase